MIVQIWINSDGNSSIYSLASEGAIVYFCSGDKKLKTLKNDPALRCGEECTGYSRALNSTSEEVHSMYVLTIVKLEEKVAPVGFDQGGQLFGGWGGG